MHERRRGKITLVTRGGVGIQLLVKSGTQRGGTLSSIKKEGERQGGGKKNILEGSR